MKERNELYAQSLAQLIRVETVSVEGQQDLSKFYRFHQELKELFPLVFSAADLQVLEGSLLLRWQGQDPALSPVVFMSHHDVVEATGKWDHPPFSGAIADGKLWGRGTLDTKGNLWAMLQAANELAAEEYTPQRDVYFVSACNEETSGIGGDRISRLLQEQGIRPFMVLDEGGMILEKPIAAANGVFAMVGVGEKGAVDLKFTARSNGGHASTPGKNTPLVRLGKFMAAVEKADLFRAKMSDVTQEMLRRMAPTMSGYMKFLCKNIGLFKGIMTKAMPAVSATAGAMVKTTLAFTMAQGSEGTNVLPQEAWVIGNMRLPHHQGQTESIAALEKLAKKFDIQIEVLSPALESPVCDYRSEAFRLVERAVEAVYPGVKTVPYLMTGASDSRFFSRVCDNCIRFAPFRISEQQLNSVHGLNESVDLDTLAPAVDFFKYVMREM